ncbi:MAG TPA: hypothetical protein VFL59_09260 [Candidatus Nanopelagicales bacterium]|nr:hypothetical protein [Candidatus Nanopelagicales bacterium]
MAVTDAPRTAIDLARTVDLPRALAPVDSALRLLLAPRHPQLEHALRRRDVAPVDVEQARDELVTVLDGMVAWPGTRIARTAVQLGDPASASPYESWSRGWLLMCGLPTPELNVVLVGASGAPYVVDFLWREHRVVGEADGAGKYGSTAADIHRAVRAEKQRQADLEAAGWRFVRWTRGDSGRALAARVQHALVPAAPLPRRP